MFPLASAAQESQVRNPAWASVSCWYACTRRYYLQQGTYVVLLTCINCVRQRPCARKVTLCQFLRTKITLLDANSIKMGFGATSGEPIRQQDPPQVPTKQKCGMDYKVKCNWNQDLVKISPSQSLWVIQHSALFSLTPCSPLKPPNGTPRPEELNQVMI